MNILKINGQALEGIYVDAAISFNKPAKRVSTYSVPGRNGDLVIDEGTFDNVLITYPVFEKSTFPTEFDAIVNYLASLEGYQRIECSNDPTHYRLGRFVVPQNPMAKRLNRDGYYQLSFDCKPQRWTLDGEEETEIDNTMVVIASDDTPYLFRKAGGAEDIEGADRATLSALTGASVGWNQFCQKYVGGGTVNDVIFTPNADGSVSVSGTANGTAIQYVPNNDQIKAVVGHKYYACGCPSGGGNNTWQLSVRVNNGSTVVGEDFGNGKIIAFTTSTANDVFAVLMRITSGATINAKYLPQLFDLTLMFGSAIADEAYAKEESVAGSGIAWLKSAGFFTKSYYPYDAGSIVSVNTEGRKVVGFNQWDEEWESGYYFKSTSTNKVVKASSGTTIRCKNPIKVLPNMAYQIVGNVYKYFFSDADGYYISEGTNKSLTTPSGAQFMYFYCENTTTYANDICINLSDPAKNGTYEPYTSQTYPIPSTDLRGITKLTDGKITYDGDTFLPNGTVNRKYGIVDLGTLEWTYSSQYNRFAATSANNPTLNAKPTATNYDVGNILCDRYATTYSNKTAETAGNYMIAVGSGGGINVRNENYTDAAAFKTAMSGVYLVYELATPTTEDEQEWQGVELVYPEGTEQFIDERTVPFAVGHDTDYFNHIGYVINNPTHFNSKPLIRVYGDGTFTVNNTTVIIAAHTEPYIDIDCELQECFYEDTNMNSYVSFSDNDFPELIPGANGFMPTPGITKLVVTPRWWIL